jgi:hypothetical protein
MPGTLKNIHSSMPAAFFGKKIIRGTKRIVHAVPLANCNCYKPPYKILHYRSESRFFSVRCRQQPERSGSVRGPSVVLSKATFAAVYSPSRRVGRTSGRLPGNDCPRPTAGEIAPPAAQCLFCSHSPGRVCMRSEGGYRDCPCGHRSSSGRAPQETVLSGPRQSQRPVVGPWRLHRIGEPSPIEEAERRKLTKSAQALIRTAFTGRVALLRRPS